MAAVVTTVVVIIWMQHHQLKHADEQIARLTNEVTTLKNSTKVAELNGRIDVLNTEIATQANKITQIQSDIDKKKLDASKPYVGTGMTSNEIAKGFRSLSSN